MNDEQREEWNRLSKNPAPCPVCGENDDVELAALPSYFGREFDDWCCNRCDWGFTARKQED